MIQHNTSYKTIKNTSLVTVFNGFLSNCNSELGIRVAELSFSQNQVF